MRQLRWMVSLLAVAGVMYAAESKNRNVVVESRQPEKRVNAVVSKGPLLYATALSSGVAFPFSLPAQAQPTLFAGDFSFTIAVPANATSLTIELVTTTPNVDVDLYARFAQDVTLSGGQPVADHRSEGLTGNESIVVTASTSPTLRTGTYFISLLLYDTGVTASGTIKATVETGGAPPPPPPSGSRQLTSGVPSAYSYPAVAQPTMFAGENSFRIDVPAGATQLRIDLVTTTAGVDVDLYARSGRTSPPERRRPTTAPRD